MAESKELTIVLLALILIYSGESSWETKKWATCTPAIEDISDKRSLAHICSKDSNLLSGITEETHILEHSNSIFCFSKVLDEMWRGLLFPVTLVVLDVDELEFVAESVKH